MKMINQNFKQVPTLQVGSHQCSRLHPTLVIAEEGQANQGDFEFAMKMIDLAADCGADGIEFQLFMAEDLYVKNHPGFQLYKRREYSKTALGDLIDATHSRNMLFQAACLSDKIFDMIVELGADIFVINATDLNNPRMLDAAGSCGKPFLIATLIGTIEEIDWAVSRVVSRGATNFALLHGQHIMGSQKDCGVPVKNTQLDCILMMEKKYGVPVGFVDHTHSEIMPAIAASRGAVMVTKHLSPYNGWKGPDWQICLDPEAWKRAMANVKYANDAKGTDKTLCIEEIGDRTIMRRSIVAARDIPEGKSIEASDINFKRPGGGLSPCDFKKYLGEVVKKTVHKDELLTKNMFINI